MRLTRISIYLFLVSPLVLPGEEAGDFSRIFHGYREAASFTRVGEYIAGRPKAGEAGVERTQPGEREGYYFLVRLKQPRTSGSVKFVLDVIDSADFEPRRFVFTLRASTSTCLLGITGADWRTGRNPPVAWKITARTPDGPIIAEQSSFLWSSGEEEPATLTETSNSSLQKKPTRQAGRHTPPALLASRFSLLLHHSSFGFRSPR